MFIQYVRKIISREEISININFVSSRFFTSAFILVIFLLVSLPRAGSNIAWADEGYNYKLECGEVNSTSPQPISATMLIGGAESGKEGEDAATRWFLQRADRGDYLVLRHGGTRGQAKWICDNYNSRVSSAAELSIDTREAANDPDVEQYIRDAEALFIAGGDQNAYQDTWEGTYVEDAINYLINDKGVPVAGTSAGMAILGEYYYAPAGRDGVFFGNGENRGADAYFLQAQETPERLEPEEPLIWDSNGSAVKVYRIRGTTEGSGSFDLNNWESASGGSWEYWYTTDGEPGFTRDSLGCN